MAHLWLAQPKADNQWLHSALEGALFELNTKQGPVALDSISDVGDGELLIQRVIPSAGNILWVLLRKAGVKVSINGSVFNGHIRLLHDRDYLVVGSQNLYFSTEQLPVIAPFIKGKEKIFCPRCKLEVEDGQKAVDCPQCSLTYHEDADLGLTCFTYAESCVNGHSTSLEGAYRWTPEEV